MQAPASTQTKAVTRRSLCRSTPLPHPPWVCHQELCKCGLLCPKEPHLQPHTALSFHSMVRRDGGHLMHLTWQYCLCARCTQNCLMPAIVSCVPIQSMPSQIARSSFLSHCQPLISQLHTSAHTAFAFAHRGIGRHPLDCARGRACQHHNRQGLGDRGQHQGGCICWGQAQVRPTGRATNQRSLQPACKAM